MRPTVVEKMVVLLEQKIVTLPFQETKKGFTTLMEDIQQKSLHN
jgi:hypothetical protein